MNSSRTRVLTLTFVGLALAWSSIGFAAPPTDPTVPTTPDLSTPDPSTPGPTSSSSSTTTTTTSTTTTTIATTSTTTTSPPTSPPSTTATTARPTTTAPRSSTTATTAAPTTLPAPPTPACAPVTTTTTTTTLPGATTTTTTTTTVPGSTTTTTTTTTLPPCPTTTTTTTTTVPGAPPPTNLPPPAPAPLGVAVPADLADIMFTIRFLESGGRYDAPPNRGNASGAYQYIASTWSNYGGYPHAYLAPPAVQDERALADVRAILARWKGDVSMVPVIWYYPKAATDATLMDLVPVPSAGNRLTVREYQHRWLNVFAYVTGNIIKYGLEAVPPDLKYISGLPPELAVLQPVLDQIAYPVLGRSVVVPPMECIECDGGTEAIVYGQKLQPILAVVDGVVTAREVEDPISGAVTLSITDRRGNTFHYSGFNDDTPGTDDGAADPTYRFTPLAEVGTPVWAGQILGYMGDTDPMPLKEHLGVDDEPVWPHLRLRATGPDGTPLDTDSLVVAAQLRQACHVGIGPWSVPPLAPTDGAAAAGAPREDVFVSAFLDGGWTLHADGTVTAVGRAALIVPPVDCVWAPQEPFGPGASGNRPPDQWGGSFTISAQHWVNGVLTASDDLLVAPVRR